MDVLNEMLASGSVPLSLGACVVFLSVAVLFYAAKSEARKTEARETEAVSFVGAWVVFSALLAVVLTAAFLASGVCAAAYPGGDPPEYVLLTSFLVYVSINALGVFPAVVLCYLISSLTEADRKKREENQAPSG